MKTFVVRKKSLNIVQSSSRSGGGQDVSCDNGVGEGGFLFLFPDF